MMLWDNISLQRALYLFGVCVISMSDETVTYGMNSIINENLPQSSFNRGRCTVNEAPKESKYKCQLESNTELSDMPDAYLDVVDMASISDADVVATIHGSSELQGYRAISGNSEYNSDDGDVINYELVSDVLSCSVYQNNTARSTEVIFSIKLGQYVRGKDEYSNFVKKNALCVFWDSNRSTWSTWGCSRNFADASSSYVKCNCNHTTSFAIIAPMEKYDPLGKKAIGIRVPTYTACLISIIVQLAVIWHIVKLRNLIKDYDYVFAICNLLAASIATTVTLVCSIEFSRFLIPCTISGIVMHFFYTATLAWLATEGAHYYLKVKGKTIEEGYTNKRYYSAFAWALPAALVGIFVGAHRGYGKHDRCLLTSYGGILPAFIFSAVLFLTVKFILLVVAMRGYKEYSRTVKYKHVFVKIRRCVVESVFVIPYLGVIWVFGMTTHTCYVVQVLFYVLFALQGLVLSVYCYFTKEIELARNRSTRQGMVRLRSLSHQEPEFGRVPLEEMEPAEGKVGKAASDEVKDQRSSDHSDEDESQENAQTAEEDTVQKSIASINMETSPSNIEEKEADDDVESVLKRVVKNDEATSENGK